jgi:hypothetical protein
MKKDNIFIKNKEIFLTIGFYLRINSFLLDGTAIYGFFLTIIINKPLILTPNMIY